jgi:hypothetical protein
MGISYQVPMDDPAMGFAVVNLSFSDLVGTYNLVVNRVDPGVNAMSAVGPLAAMLDPSFSPDPSVTSFAYDVPILSNYDGAGSTLVISPATSFPTGAGPLVLNACELAPIYASFASPDGDQNFSCPARCTGQAEAMFDPNPSSSGIMIVFTLDARPGVTFTIEQATTNQPLFP